jgi:hypothetical protein
LSFSLGMPFVCFGGVPEASGVKLAPIEFIVNERLYDEGKDANRFKLNLEYAIAKC